MLDTIQKKCNAEKENIEHNAKLTINNMEQKHKKQMKDMQDGHNRVYSELIKNNKDLEKEIKALRIENENTKNKKMQSKAGLNAEYQNSIDIYKQRFEQIEEKNKMLQKYVNELEQKIALKEKEINENNKLKSMKPENNKLSNLSLFNELQNNFNEKAKILNKEYLDKEEKIKSKYYQEIE